MSCPVCDAEDSGVFFEQRDALVFCNRQARTRDDALAAPRADLRLAICDRCTQIYNTAFDPERVAYTADYENSLHFSETFGRHARGLAEMLIDRFDLHGKYIADVGCGDGAFLRLLCELGGNRGTGFDPAAAAATGDVEIVAAPYSAAYAGPRADFVCCRHVLEHQGQPRDFLVELKPLLRQAWGAYYFEVPNAVKTFCDGFVWDVLYEHCSYFTPRSLQALFARIDLDVSALGTLLGGQFLSLLGRKAAGAPVERLVAQPSDLWRRVRGFARQRADAVERWRSRLRELRVAGRTVVVWGAGSKGVTFLDAVAGPADVAAVVDVNPRKQGTWLPGSGLQVLAPAALQRIRPHTVVLMNPIYRDEVHATLDDLGLAPEITTV